MEKQIKKDNNKMKTGKQLKIGDKVLCKYFNSMDKEFAKESFTGIVINIKPNQKSNNPNYYGEFETIYVVENKNPYFKDKTNLHKKEIIKILD